MYKRLIIVISVLNLCCGCASLSTYTRTKINEPMYIKPAGHGKEYNFNINIDWTPISKDLIRFTVVTTGYSLPLCSYYLIEGDTEKNMYRKISPMHDKTKSDIKKSDKITTSSSSIHWGFGITTGESTAQTVTTFEKTEDFYFQIPFQTAKEFTLRMEWGLEKYEEYHDFIFGNPLYLYKHKEKQETVTKFNIETYMVNNIDWNKYKNIVISGKFATDILESINRELLKRKFNVITSDREKLLKEQKLNLSGAIDLNTRIEVGKLYGANVIIMGEGGNEEIHIEIISIETGAILFSASYKRNFGELHNLSEVVRELLQEIPVL